MQLVSAEGQPFEKGVPLDCFTLGATLLAALDVDPGEWLAGATPIRDALA